MALITRISRLFSADFHAVLDRIEDPELLLKQAIREMEEELLRGEQRIKWLQQEQQQLCAEEDDIEQTRSNLDEEMDICFASGKDDLARKLVKRKLEAQLQLKRVTGRHRAGGKALAELQAAVTENHGHLDNMRQKAELLLGREEAGVPLSAWPGECAAKESAVPEEEVEVAFLREKQRRSQS
ncbi:MAG: PspA/IM30 family protein [Lysobacterales bacterium]